MPDIDIETDLNSVNEQVVKLVDELNKISAARENLIQQVQNLNGVAMYLRGKLSPQSDDKPEFLDKGKSQAKKTEFERSVEYPNEKS